MTAGFCAKILVWSVMAGILIESARETLGESLARNMTLPIIILCIVMLLWEGKGD
jgi:hypothetical protein